MNRILSGKKTSEILERLGHEKTQAIQSWVNYEAQSIADRYLPDLHDHAVSLIDQVNSDGVCTHCKNYNMRFMLKIENIKQDEVLGLISFSERCIQEFFKIDEESTKKFCKDIKQLIRQWSKLLTQIAESNYKPVKYPTGLKVNHKIDPLIAADLPVPESYVKDLQLALYNKKLLENRTQYYVKYQKYIRYVRLSLKLQPHSPFLISLNERFKNCEPLTPGMIEALERGMTPGWENKLKEAIEIKEKNMDIMQEHDRRLERLLMCKLGFTKNIVLSFRKQLRNGKPLSPKQIETLESWEEKFAKQLEELDEQDPTRCSLASPSFA